MSLLLLLYQSFHFIFVFCIQFNSVCVVTLCSLAINSIGGKSVRNVLHFVIQLLNSVRRQH